MQSFKRFLQEHPVPAAIVGLVFTGLPAVQAWWGLFSDEPIAEVLQKWLAGSGPMTPPTIGQIVALAPSVLGLLLLGHIAHLQRNKPTQTDLEDAVDTLQEVGTQLEGALETIEEGGRHVVETEQDESEEPVEQEVELGLFDLLERAQGASSEIEQLTRRLTEATVVFGDTVGKRADQLDALDPQSPDIVSTARPILSRTAREVRVYADEVEDIEKPLGDGLDKALDALLQAAEIWEEDFEGDVDKVREARDAAKRLQVTVSTAAEAVTELEATIDSWPRISKEIINARAKATAILRRLGARLTDAASKAGDVASRFDDML